MRQVILNSNEVFNSNIIVDSNKVCDSINIIDSTNVQKSVNIYNSHWVQESSDVYSSSTVIKSEKVVLSKNVEQGFNIIDSNICSKSSNVKNSSEVLESNGILYSKKTTKSAFLMRCENMTNCYFCCDVTNGDNLLFNKPVEPMFFNFVTARLQDFLKDMRLNFVEDWPNELYIGKDPSIKYSFKIIFECLTNEFMEWVKSLPNYDPIIFYRIVYQPSVLLDNN